MTNADQSGSETIANGENTLCDFPDEELRSRCHVVSKLPFAFRKVSFRKTHWSTNISAQGLLPFPRNYNDVAAREGRHPLRIRAAFFRSELGDWKGAPSGRESDGEIVSQTERDEIKRRTDGTGGRRSPGIIRLRARAQPENIQSL